MHIITIKAINRIFSMQTIDCVHSKLFFAWKVSIIESIISDNFFYTKHLFWNYFRTAKKSLEVCHTVFKSVLRHIWHLVQPYKYLTQCNILYEYKDNDQLPTHSGRQKRRSFLFETRLDKHKMLNGESKWSNF